MYNSIVYNYIKLSYYYVTLFPIAIEYEQESIEEKSGINCEFWIYKI